MNSFHPHPPNPSLPTVVDRSQPSIGFLFISFMDPFHGYGYKCFFSLPRFWVLYSKNNSACGNGNPFIVVEFPVELSSTLLLNPWRVSSQCQRNIEEGSGHSHVYIDTYVYIYMSIICISYVYIYIHTWWCMLKGCCFHPIVRTYFRRWACQCPLTTQPSNWIPAPIFLPVPKFLPMPPEIQNPNPQGFWP